MRRRRARRGHLVVPICTVALVAGCGGGSSPGAAPSPLGSVGAEISADAVADVLPNDLEAETFLDMDRSAWQQLQQAATSLPWHMVSAAGVEQAAACIGQGAPTVVYIDGFASAAAPNWSLAAVEQSDSNRVCLFDRPGMGLSPPRAGAAPHSTPEQHAQEMLDMLAVLGEPGPYLLVPWSYGGLVARAASAQHPDLVAGMVLVDATSPLLPGLDEPWNGENGIIDTDTIIDTVTNGPDMGNRPLIVLQAGVVDASSPLPDTHAQWDAAQHQAATISENSVYAVVDASDHAIPIRNPSAVVAATTAVAESIRTGNADLPACPDDLAAAGVTCKGA